MSYIMILVTVISSVMVLVNVISSVIISVHECHLTRDNVARLKLSWKRHGSKSVCLSEWQMSLVKMLNKDHLTPFWSVTKRSTCGFGLGRLASDQDRKAWMFELVALNHCTTRRVVSFISSAVDITLSTKLANLKRMKKKSISSPSVYCHTEFGSLCYCDLRSFLQVME